MIFYGKYHLMESMLKTAAIKEGDKLNCRSVAAYYAKPLKRHPSVLIYFSLICFVLFASQRTSFDADLVEQLFLPDPDSAPEEEKLSELAKSVIPIAVKNFFAALSKPTC